MRQPRYHGVDLWLLLWALGLIVELLVLVVARFWSVRYSVDSLSLGPVVLVVAASSVFLGAQLVSGLFAVESVAAMSLVLLAAMTSWLGIGLVAVGMLLLLAVSLCALLLVPARLVYFALTGSGGRRHLPPWD